MDHEIDNNFMSYLEMKKPDIKFKRVDSELSGKESDEETKNKLKELAIAHDKPLAGVVEQLIINEHQGLIMSS